MVLTPAISHTRTRTRTPTTWRKCFDSKIICAVPVCVESTLLTQLTFGKYAYLLSMEQLSRKRVLLHLYLSLPLVLFQAYFPLPNIIALISASFREIIEMFMSWYLLLDTFLYSSFWIFVTVFCFCHPPSFFSLKRKRSETQSKIQTINDGNRCAFCSFVSFSLEKI